MSIFDDAERSLSTTDESDEDSPTETSGDRINPDRQSWTTAVRGQDVTVQGDTLEVSEPDTEQPLDDAGSWIMGSSNKYGVPRGAEAIKQRRITQTAAMQSIVNGIVDQLLGGDLAFIDSDGDMDDLGESELEAATDLKEILRDVLTGPHMGGHDLDDLVAACVEDMLGPGNAYLQLLQPESGDLPVVSLSTLDPITIRHNVAESGMFKDPPYYQATGAFNTGTSVGDGAVDPTALDHGDVCVLSYPKGNRSYRVYPASASWQIKEWLEILADSTTHHKRYYSDNEVPPGLLQVVDASDSTIDTIQNELEQARGDPRSVPITGGEAPAQWIEMGGTAINLDLLSEQEWFFKLCLGALGLGKQEVGFIEDVNRANGRIEAERVYKRVAGPFGEQFKQAFLEVARKFEAFRELGEPFTPELVSTDPRAEQAKRERLRKDYEAGKITLNEFVRRSPDGSMSEDEMENTVTVGGQTIDYGDHPKWVAQRLMSAAGAADPEQGGGPEGGPDEGDDEE
ncbi:hypothetical protein OSG_eHP3_00135 [environmental Halophage eHP-3]|nr:hypothetical protein OSG_eHP3_00135 [environmental Halophage eHP-3]